MSKLEELIQRYCPDGVEYKPLGEICKPLHKGTLTTKELVEPDGSNYPVINSGRELYGYYPQFNNEGDAFTVAARGEYAGYITYFSERFWAGGLCYPYRSNSPVILTKFVFYCLKTKQEYIRHTLVAEGSIPALNKGTLDLFEIPIPPLPVQEEIVRVLDTFTELQAELQAELQLREQQYNYYQDLLLNKSQFSHLVAIGDMCEIKKGNTPIQKAKEGDYPLVVTTMERRSSDTYQFNANAVCIPLISSRGHGVASLNHVYYQEGKFALGNILCAVIPHDEKILKAKFLYYYLEYAKDYTLVPLMKGGANVSMHCSDIEKVKIPLPSLDEQERIISILDKFDSLTNDLTAGLPAEIEKRRQQYEFYRDKLLTFKRKEA